MTGADLDSSWSLDAVDTRLLSLLAADARASLRSLGSAVGLSGPSVAERIARLRSRGVIRAFTVDIDWARLGMPTLAHISLLTDKSSHIEQIVATLRTVERVEEISIVTGSTDLLVRARVADLTELRQLLVEHIWPIPGIQRVETTLAVQTVQAPQFVDSLLEHAPATPRAPHEALDQGPRHGDTRPGGTA
ncbi:Lrp/AsnC family transcriptional regulator [Ornithinimicrobium sp. W1665]|uniref:Lrp/AsnC family transcriptional regulator n=1 Tax=Ornithinimicrobium sp. W1665 TaxID=3416666 RepID=UPI003CE8A597